MTGVSFSWLISLYLFQKAANTLRVTILLFNRTIWQEQNFHSQKRISAPLRHLLPISWFAFRQS
jgi:hypothetical protein